MKPGQESGIAEEALTSLHARLWFPDPADEVRAGGFVPRMLVADLPSGDRVHVVIEPVRQDALRWEDEGPTFIFLPDQGMSAREIRNTIQWSVRYPYFLRIFDQNQTVHPGETSPAQNLWAEIERDFCPEADGFRGYPFFGRSGEPAMEDDLQRWMKGTVVAFSVRKLYQMACRNLLRSQSRFLREAANRGREGDRDAEANWDVLTELYIRARCLNGKVRTRLDEFGRTGASARAVVRNIFEAEYKRVVHAFGVSTRITLLPLAQRATKVWKQVEAAAADWEILNNRVLRDIAVQLRGHISSEPPLIAVMGLFSSGKTTLLNTVLLGEKEGCAFATKNTANTAVMYRIRRTPEGEDEKANYTFRKRFHCELGSRGPSGYWMEEDFRTRTLSRMSEILCLDFVQNARLSCHHDDGSMFSEARREEIRTFLREPLAWIEGVERRLRATSLPPSATNGIVEKKRRTRRHRTGFGRVGLEVEVDLDHPAFRKFLSQEKIPASRPLKTPADWEAFREGGDESFLASLLVEQVTVWIQTDLLRLTSIADTPGLGSAHSHHDWVARNSIKLAEGFVVVLCTGGRQAATATVQALEELRSALRERGDDSGTYLKRIGFVINLFRDRGAGVYETDSAEVIGQCRTVIARVFDLSEREMAGLNLFVVDLKSPHPEDNGEEMFGFPSLHAFRKWLEGDLLAQEAYQARLRGLREILSTRWDESKQNLRRERKRLQRKDEKVAEQAAALRAFGEKSLSDWKDRLEAQTGAVEAEIDELRAALDSVVDPYLSDPGTRDETAPRIQAAFETVYAAVNHFVDSSETDLFAGWLSRVQHDASNRDLDWTLPPVAGVDPKHYDVSRQAKLSVIALRRQIDRTKAQWPLSWLEKLKSWIGQSDARLGLLLTLGNEVVEEFDGVVANPWRRYLVQCRLAAGQAVETWKKDGTRLAGDRERRDPAVLEAMRGELEDLNKMEEKRQELYAVVNGLLVSPEERRGEG